MAIYSVNQNRQFYVISSVVETTPTTLGQLQVCSTADGQIFFKHMGKGGLTRTDLIDLDKICYTKLTPKADMQRKLKKITVALDSNINSGAPVAGQDYILRMEIGNYLAPGDANVLIKSSAVHAVTGMTAAQFYQKLAASLKMNFSRDPQPILDFTATANGVVITELGNQPWRLGILSEEGVNFKAIPTTIKVNNDEVIWGTATAGETNTTVGNGRQVADIEYFCMAERGDMFRNMGWPNNIDVKYMVDPTAEYDLFDLHYFFSGSGVQVHKSEKDITFAASTEGVMDDLVDALTTAGVFEAPVEEEEE